VLTDHHNLQGFMKNKLLRGRLGRWWETLSGYDLEIVYRTGKTNSADDLSCRPDYKATPEAENRQKQAQETRASESEEAHTNESEKVCGGESDEVREEAVHIDAAQLLGLWGQRLATTICRWMPIEPRAPRAMPTGCSQPWSNRRKQKERRSSCQVYES
jgi:hypothetical protein